MARESLHERPVPAPLADPEAPGGVAPVVQPAHVQARPPARAGQQGGHGRPPRQRPLAARP
eukprot:6766531-Lingulodinium_polyedra.AAC.1